MEERNNKEIMEKHLERAETCVKMVAETGRQMLFAAASEIERDMAVRMLKDLSMTVSEEILLACMEGIVGRFPVNRAMLPFIAGAFGAARELVLTACAGEQSEEDLAKLSKVADEVAQMLVERSTVVTAKVKVEYDRPE